MRPTIVALSKHEFIDGGERRSVVFSSGGGSPEVVWWEVIAEGGLLPGAPQNEDIALTSLLFLAMSRRQPLHIEGRVSRSLLERAERFIAIWTLWRPDLYSPISISADDEIADRAPDPDRDRQAVCAFSGGVDAAYTVWSHTAELAGRATRKLLGGVYIQGFDIGLDDHEASAVTEQQCSLMLNSINVPFIKLKTNWKRDICHDWEMEFGIGVFSCLKLWDDHCRALLAGSCEDYARLVVPWGSHPLPTSLLSSLDVENVYDGGELNRTQKVARLSAWKNGYDSLRVCWQGDITGYNCGVCEKCIRTKLNAIVNNLELPASLPGRPTRRQVSRLGPMIAPQRELFQEILDEAALRDIQDPLFPAMRVAMARTKAPFDVRLRGKIKSLLR